METFLMPPPDFPVGPFELVKGTRRQLREWISEIEHAPGRLWGAIAGLSDAQLDTRYKNWTVRQIVHHLADSHVNSYVRFKWALTEERPTIKAYDEGRWAALEDSRSGDVAAPLALVEALHARWVLLLTAMTEEQFARSFVHPETGKTIGLSDALCYYAWHGRHHTGQILWLRTHHGWSK
jgi:uncharacterized damage-inducible protein DinB